MGPRAHWIVNFIAFQVGWFACVLGAAGQRPWLGTTFVVVAVLLHLSLLSHQPRPEAMLIAMLALAGAGWDSVVLNLAPIHYTSGQLHPGLSPHWILALWALFAATLDGSMRWVRRHVGVAVLVGAVGGPLAYLAGAELGAAAIPSPTRALMLQALGWAVLVPLACVLAQRLLVVGPGPVAIPDEAGRP